MPFSGRALITSAMVGFAVLGACAGGEPADASRAASEGGSGTSRASASPPPPGTPLPITGRIHEVRMIGDNNGYRYEPSRLTIRSGDGVRWIMVSGAPHNVAFDQSRIPDDVEPQLAANMPNQVGLASPMMLNANESYTISFAAIPAGTYEYHCTPHLAMGMTARVTVR